MAGIQQFWRKIQSVVQSGVNQKVTRMGLVFTFATVLVAVAAFSSANNLLFLILAAMLATLMISGLVSRLSLSGLALDLILPDHLYARKKMSGMIVVQNEKRWMGSFSIDLAAYGPNPIAQPLYFPLIGGGSSIEQTVELYFERRGSHARNSFRFSTRFPFGFAERRIYVLVKREVLVYPSIEPQPGFDDLLLELNGEIESRYRGQSSDFYRIRPYEALESARHVDWRATAHTGDLQVREFAREQEQAVVLSLDLNTGEGDTVWFERAVDCCAYLAWHLALRGTRVRFRTQVVDIQTPQDGDVYSVLEYLATVTPLRGALHPIGNDRTTFEVVFSLSALNLGKAGWDLSQRNVRFVGTE